MMVHVLALIVEGCTDSLYVEYNSEANQDDGSCATLVVEGCLDINYQEYNSAANVSNEELCQNLEIEGCTDSTAFNYNENATQDDGSCVAVVEGCLNSLAEITTLMRIQVTILVNLSGMYRY